MQCVGLYVNVMHHISSTFERTLCTAKQKNWKNLQISGTFVLFNLRIFFEKFVKMNAVRCTAAPRSFFRHLGKTAVYL